MPGKKTVLLVYHNYSTFVKADDEILGKCYNVQRYHFIIAKCFFPFTWAFIRQLFYLIKHAGGIDVFYCWFSDYHALLPVLFAKLLRKQSVVIVGGYDSVSIPEIEYGVFLRRNIRALFARLSYKLTKYISAVDASLIEGVNTYIDSVERPIGLTRYVSNVGHKCVTIPTGYDENRWRKPSSLQKSRYVLSVAVVSTINELRRKGLDFLLDVAAQMPEVKFTLIGLRGQAKAYCTERQSPNIEILGLLPNDELVDHFARAKVFCQFSLYEGLPNTLCEAMLSECIPVGSNIPGIVTGIGEAGFILQKRDKQQAKKLISKALNSDDALGEKARNHIIDHFLTRHRERAIFSLIDTKMSS